MNSLIQCPNPVDFWRDFGAYIETTALKLVEILELFPDFRFRSIEIGISRHTIDRLERIGRGQICPEIALKFGRQYQLAAKLPPSIQKDIIANGVEVLLATGDTRCIPLDDLTPAQASQAIGKTLAQQRTWLDSRTPPARCDNDVRVKRDRVVFHGYEITKRQILGWLVEMK